MGTLYIVSTPIGNLKDITLRALETLQDVDGIICEDTRRTGILLSHYSIKKPLFILNDFNESKNLGLLISRLKSGEKLALVSDAGTPLVSDPGYKLVRECINENILVDAIPGPSAVIEALVLSGMPPNKFTFLGYPPEKPGQRLKFFQNIRDREHNSVCNGTVIFYISPHKLIKTLLDIQSVFGEIEIVLAHELTKIHQSVEKKSVSNWLTHFEKRPPKGEYVLLISLS